MPHRRKPVTTTWYKVDLDRANYERLQKKLQAERQRIVKAMEYLAQARQDAEHDETIQLAAAIEAILME